MVTLIAKNQNRFGGKVTLFAAGTVEISSEGKFEVESEEIANEVLETYPDDFALDGEIEATTTTTTTAVVTETTTIATTTTETTTAAPETFTKTEEDELNGDSEKDLLIKSLEGKSLDELKVLAAPFPKAEWKNKKTVEEMTEYLKAKILS